MMARETRVVIVAQPEGSIHGNVTIDKQPVRYYRTAAETTRKVK